MRRHNDFVSVTATRLLALAVILAGASRLAGAEPMEFWDALRWDASNDITQAVSITGKAGLELSEVVNVGDVNGDGYTDILVRASTTKYALILGGSSLMKNMSAAMDIEAAGLVQCWFTTTDTQGGPYLMRARALGDIDHDGRADFCIIGSNTSAGGANCYKWKYIVFGRATWPTGTYDLNVTSTATPKDHLELHNVLGGQLNSNVSRGEDFGQKLGDLDGDGIDDMALVLPSSSFYAHGLWHDNSFQIRFYKGNTNRTAILFYARDGLDIPWGTFDRIWQGCTGGTYNKIMMADMDGNGRNDLLLASQGNFPIYVWKADNFRTLGATPAEDTPKAPQDWPGDTVETDGTHAGETNDLLSADCLLNISGFGTDLLTATGDLDGDGTENLVFSSWQYAGWWSGNVVLLDNFTSEALTGTNWVTLSGQTNWIHRWTKNEGDGWYWAGRGMACAGDLNGDGLADLLVDDRLGDLGHSKGYTAGGVRFVAGSTNGWTTTTRLSLPLILTGEHDDNGLTKTGDGLASPIVDVSGFGEQGGRGFAVVAPYWDPDGTTSAYGKVYLVCPFSSVNRAGRIRVW